MVVLLLFSQKITQDVNTRELYPACRRMDRPNRKSISLPKPINCRARHANPFRQIIQIDDRWEFARESDAYFRSASLKYGNRHIGLSCFVIGRFAT